VGLVNDGFSLVRRVGGPDGVRVNEAHAPHRGEQRFKREALFLSRPTPSRRSRAHPLGSGSACRAASRRVASRCVTSRRVATKDARVKIRSRRMAAAPNRSVN